MNVTLIIQKKKMNVTWSKTSGSIFLFKEISCFFSFNAVEGPYRTTSPHHRTWIILYAK